MPNADITKRAIADAMKRLMQNEPLAKISIGDITKACGVTRNSFYYHFKDKFDLVNWIFYTELTQAVSTDEGAALDATSWTLIEGICTYFYENKRFYQNALTITGQNSFVEYFEELLGKWIVAKTEEWYAADENRDFFVLFFANAFVSAIVRWLMDGAKTPPDQLTQLIRKAVTGAAIRLIEIEGLQDELK